MRIPTWCDSRRQDGHGWAPRASSRHFDMDARAQGRGMAGAGWKSSPLVAGRVLVVAQQAEGQQLDLPARRKPGHAPHTCVGEVPATAQGDLVPEGRKHIGGGASPDVHIATPLKVS